MSVCLTACVNVMADLGQIKLVKAVFNYKAKNNDELNFNKGDMITVTQVVEGGWWEGTLGDKTGWFPSNYVKEIKADARSGAKSPTGGRSVGANMGPEGDIPVTKRESTAYYHNVVLQNMLETEKTHVSEILSFLQTYLRPLHTAQVLGAVEFSELTGNIEDICTFQQGFLASLEECAKLPIHQQRTGGIFIRNAAKFKSLYGSYCANHPKAVSVLQNKREDLSKFMESKGAPTPGIMTLTACLSKPFVRLDRYPSLLKELERHIDGAHVDRGDTQRAIEVYRDIQIHCTETRKQKEMEYEIMSSVIKGWEGEEIDKLGDVITMSHVHVYSENGERKERLFLLFSSQLVMLSVSPRMSGYQYEGKLPISGMAVSKLEDTDNYTNAFEITSCMIDRIVVACHSGLEQNRWLEALKIHISSSHHLSGKPQSLQVKPISTSQPSISTLSQQAAKTAKVMHQQPFRAALKTAWSMSFLRPCPPLRPSLFVKDEILSKSPRTGRKLLSTAKRKPERARSEEEYSSRRIDDPKTLEDDALLLRVIEAYCTSAKTRHTVNSSLLDCPQMLIAEEEKIIVEETKGNQTVVEEKSLVDTVYSLRDQVKELKQDHKRMRKDLDEEKKARKRLENLLRKSKLILESPVEEVST